MLIKRKKSTSHIDRLFPLTIVATFLHLAPRIIEVNPIPLLITQKIFIICENIDEFIILSNKCVERIPACVELSRLLKAATWNNTF
ncbi:MAG: hypothetical protein ACRDHZ_22010 [Ktedonobacteraceae bacterium]